MQISSSSNTSLLPPVHCTSNSSNYPPMFTCTDGIIYFTIYNCINILFLPLYILILWMGFQRWRQQCSVTAGTTSHSDFIAYHMVFADIIGVLGIVFFSSAKHMCNMRVMMVGYFSLTIIYPAQTFFHCLTCIEHYLAVVHPITYMALRKEGGVMVRNVGISCVWLLSFGIMVFTALTFPHFPMVINFVALIFSLTIVSFCSLSALRILIRLGLGKVGGDRERIDKSKKRAFHTIMAIKGALLLRFAGLLISNFLVSLETEMGINGCLVLMFGFWFCLPSSLVLPLLYLHRAGTRACCRRNMNQREN